MRYLTLRRLASSSLLLLALLLGLTGPTAHAQAPAWQRAVAASGDVSLVQATVADASGNIYVAGSFEGTLGLGAVSLMSAGGPDIFVAKWSTATNAFVWAQRAGGTAYDRAVAVAVSGSNVYLTGYFQNTGTFGSTTMQAPGSSNALFVAKLTDAGSSGSFGWAVTGGNLNGGTTSVAVSGTSVYVAGSVWGTANYGTTTLTSLGTSDAFVAKLTDAGNSGAFVWAQRCGGPGGDAATSVVANGSSVYLTGGFYNTADFGTTNLTSVGGGDVFVAKLTDAGATGNFVWAQRAGSTATTTDLIAGVAVNGSNLYVTGNIGGTADFGATTLNSPSSVGGDAYVAKLVDAGPTGSFAWAVMATGPRFTAPRAVAVSGANVYVSGYFIGSSTFGGTTLTTTTGSDYDVFLTSVPDAGTSGSFAWALKAGGANDDRADGLAISGGSVYVGGTVAPPASFGSLAIATPTANAVGSLASVRDVALPTRPAAELAGFSLAPNPAHAAATVLLPAMPGAVAATLTLRDALGRAVRTQQVPLLATGTTAEIALAGLAPGLYRVQVQAGGQQASRVLVVE
ncbi:hypothetical protein Q5H92_20630 [Hymenobacter sp. M29]|uniref:T9SS type A sorting domain-containing protein n=1 Tax=Hymenobacter mellowenesis TaxID=3063995 RepID=A0ABT9AG31_9BACT|nr:hypothetical protein [Hymenobacter sp. M29]MDO7848784.1 hypothetical protein [Hymenobacter sp. M29]